MRFVSLSMLLSLIGCQSDEGVKAHNSDPQATITSHNDGDVILSDEVISFRATITDDNDESGDLEAQWTAGERVICSFTPPDSDGVSTCESTINEGETSVQIEVRDPQNATGTDSVTLEVMVSDVPSAEITSPEQSGSYYNDQLILFSAIIGDNEDDVTDLMYRWESNIDGVLTLDDPPETNGEIEGYTYLSEGQHAISLTVEDTSGKTTTESVTIMVGGPNHEPLSEITSPADDSVFVMGQNISQVSATPTLVYQRVRSEARASCRQ